MRFSNDHKHLPGNQANESNIFNLRLIATVHKTISLKTWSQVAKM